MGQRSIYSHFSMPWLASPSTISFLYAKDTSQFMNTALHFVLGVHPSEQISGAPLTGNEFVKAFHSALQYSMFRVMLGRMWKLFPQRKYVDACARAHGFLGYYIRQALTGNQGKKGKSLIQALSAEVDDPIFIRSQVIQATIAAQDTTSELLTNALFLLARHPRYWEQLRAEFADKPEDALSAENLLGSKLVENIIHESRTPAVPLHVTRTFAYHFASIASLPDLPCHRARRIAGHYAPRWRRPPSRLPHVHSERVDGGDALLRAPSRPQGFRRRRRGVQARALGLYPAGALGVPGLRRG